MKILFSFTLLLLVPLRLLSQEIFTYVEKMPQSSVNVLAFFNENMQYPEDAVEQNIEGKVTIKFIVDTSGRIINPYVLRSLHPSLDSEAIRVLKHMPNWKPGIKNGNPVNVYFTLPISFKLTTSSTSDIVSNQPVVNMPQPEFGLTEFLRKHLNYPNAAKALLTKGVVEVEYLIDTNGKAINLSLVKETHEEFWAEIVNVFKLMPNWKPGKVNNQVVCIKLTQKFIFDVNTIDFTSRTGNLMSSNKFTTSFSIPQFAEYYDNCMFNKQK